MLLGRRRRTPCTALSELSVKPGGCLGPHEFRAERQAPWPALMTTLITLPAARKSPVLAPWPRNAWSEPVLSGKLPTTPRFPVACRRRSSARPPRSASPPAPSGIVGAAAARHEHHRFQRIAGPGYLLQGGDGGARLDELAVRHDHGDDVGVPRRGDSTGPARRQPGRCTGERPWPARASGDTHHRTSLTARRGIEGGDPVRVDEHAGSAHRGGHGPDTRPDRRYGDDHDKCRTHEPGRGGRRRTTWSSFSGASRCRSAARRNFTAALQEVSWPAPFSLHAGNDRDIAKYGSGP